MTEIGLMERIEATRKRIEASGIMRRATYYKPMSTDWIRAAYPEIWERRAVSEKKKDFPDWPGDAEWPDVIGSGGECDSEKTFYTMKEHMKPIKIGDEMLLESIEKQINAMEPKAAKLEELKKERARLLAKLGDRQDCADPEKGASSTKLDADLLAEILLQNYSVDDVTARRWIAKARYYPPMNLIDLADAIAVHNLGHENAQKAKRMTTKAQGWERTEA